MIREVEVSETITKKIKVKTCDFCGVNLDHQRAPRLFEVVGHDHYGNINHRYAMDLCWECGSNLETDLGVFFQRRMRT